MQAQGRILFVLLALLAVGPTRAQQPAWEDLLSFPNPGGYNLFGYMRPLPGGDYLVYGIGSTGSTRVGYPSRVARYRPNGSRVFQREGRTLWTLEQDMLPLGAAGYLLVASVRDPGLTVSTPTLLCQRVRATGDTLTGLRYPVSVFTGIPGRLRPDGDSARVVLTANTTSSPTTSQYALATVDTAGHLGPVRRYANPAPLGTLGNAYACDLVPTPRGGWLLAGEGQTGATSHPYLVETDYRGRLRRQRVLTLFATGDDERVARVWHNLIRLSDGSGYVLSGWQQVGGRGASNPIWGFLCKLDTALHVVWTYRHPPQANPSLLPTSVRELPDGSLGWLAGDASGNGQGLTPYLYFIRVSAQGQLLGQRTFTSAACAGLWLYSWQPTPDGWGAVVTGGYATCAATGSGATVTYTARLDGALLLGTGSPQAGAGAAAVFPNPAGAGEEATWQGAVPAGASRAELVLTDALGRVVRRVAVAGRGAAVRQGLGPPAGLAAGPYAVRLLVNGQPVAGTCRLVVLP